MLGGVRANWATAAYAAISVAGFLYDRDRSVRFWPKEVATFAVRAQKSSRSG